MWVLWIIFNVSPADVRSSAGEMLNLIHDTLYKSNVMLRGYHESSLTLRPRMFFLTRAKC